MNATNDDEWEYEYDAVETEDFYIPIDLSNIPNRQKHTDTERRTGHPTLLKSRLRALAAQRGQQQDASSLDNVDANGAEETGEKTLSEAQIIGLHTQNPLVMYNGQLLSLTWAETIGTDLFFAKPDGNADAEEPLRSLPGVDLLGMGSAKLVARVARLRPRDEVLGREGASAQSDENAEDAQEPVQTVVPPPMSFLAKLNAAKAKRGDATRLEVARSGDGARLVARTEGADVEMGGT